VLSRGVAGDLVGLLEDEDAVGQDAGVFDAALEEVDALVEAEEQLVAGEPDRAELLGSRAVDDLDGDLFEVRRERLGQLVQRLLDVARELGFAHVAGHR
jgi:hypothetical protein